MKRHLLKSMLILLILFPNVNLLANTHAIASENQTGPKWLSSMGFWVVESNTYTPRSSTIYFYNNEKILVYKENLQGIEIDVNRRQVKMNLKKVLEQSVSAYAQSRQKKENQMLVAVLVNNRNKQ